MRNLRDPYRVFRRETMVRSKLFRQGPQSKGTQFFAIILDRGPETNSHQNFTDRS